jgi:hypothetical protein
MAGAQVWRIFEFVDRAIRKGELIRRSGSRDKEFHFQDWFGRQLDRASILHDLGGRNSYPDYTLVDSTEGFEIKGLAYPGRVADYDCNSQVPVGFHNGRQVYYVFGRYPAKVEEDEYPIVDLVICHGSLLNADDSYVHRNKSIRRFGSFGDILLRDRKMYVAPTPFALLDGTTGQRTLVLPDHFGVVDGFKPVGQFERVEVKQRLVGYSFDLSTNNLYPELGDNPTAGRRHGFLAQRLADDPGPEVKLRAAAPTQLDDTTSVEVVEDEG